MKKRIDYQGREYFNATDAAKYLQMNRTTFLFFYNKKCLLAEQFKPKSFIHLGKKCWLIEELDIWKERTSNLKFNRKKKPTPPTKKESEKSNVFNLSNKSRT
jgi:hypothetical protein|tara:strand:+ start:916 stop:1221 length:306 start_codon:yes stop_codon:yes gene_type:complete